MVETLSTQAKLACCASLALICACHAPAALKLSSGTAESPDLHAQVDSCNDGDTCRVHMGRLNLRVRLAGIDAPEAGRETSQPLGLEAKQYLNEMVAGRDVTLRGFDLDRYNRAVVEIRVGDVLVNKELVGAGLAEVYRDGPKSFDISSYEAAERDARAANRGVWSLAQYTSPSVFRRTQKARGH